MFSPWICDLQLKNGVSFFPIFLSIVLHRTQSHYPHPQRMPLKSWYLDLFLTLTQPLPLFQSPHTCPCLVPHHYWDPELKPPNGWPVSIHPFLFLPPASHHSIPWLLNPSKTWVFDCYCSLSACHFSTAQTCRLMASVTFFNTVLMSGKHHGASTMIC